MRVEEVSAQAGVSIDTIRYYQSKGLLAPPRRQGRFAWYDDEHLRRIQRIRVLQDRGFTLATIIRLVNGNFDSADEALVAELSGPLPPLPEPPVPPTRPSEAGLSLEELAERTGVPLALLKAVEAEGLLVPRRFGSSERYTEEDVAAARAGLLLLEWGVPLSALLDLSRRHHAATEDLARQAVAMFATHVRGSIRRSDAAGGSGATGAAQGADLVRAYNEILPAVNTLVGHHFTRTLLKAAFDHIELEGSDDERRAVWAEATKVVGAATLAAGELDRQMSDGPGSPDPKPASR